MVVATDTPLYNSRIFDSYLKLLKKRYLHVDVSELLRHAGMKECEVSDQGHWFSQRQVDLFHDKLVQLSGDPGIAREAGRYAASPDVLGPLRSFLLGLMGPEYLFVLVNKIAPNFSRSSRCSCRKIGHRELELTVRFEEGVHENPRQCENRIGFIEAVFLLFDYDFPEITHTECCFTGAEVCRYRIRWTPSRASRLILARRFSFSLLLSACVAVGYSYLDSNPLLGSLLLCATLIHILVDFLVGSSERKSLLSSLASMRSSSERLLLQVQGNYDSALIINEIGEVISQKTELDEILSSVNQVLEKRLGYGRGIILLANAARTALVLEGCFGFTPDQVRTLQHMDRPIDASGPKGMLDRCFQDQAPLLVNCLDDVKHQAIPENFAFFAGVGVKSFICVPIVCEGRSLGLLGVNDAKREGDLLQSDLNLIQGVAQVIGIAIRNSMRLSNERDLSEQLRRGTELLERRVEERTAELARGQEELKFLYDSVSHDLRTPLRVIYGYGELLLDLYASKLDPAAIEYLQCMIKGGEQMEATLDSVLDLSEVRQKELKLEPVDLSAMALRILHDLGVTDVKRVVNVQVQDGVVVTGDEGLLKSVMENLLGNAWKYSAAKPSSTISFGMRDGVCYVSDNGDGFDMAESDLLFRPFQRLHHCHTFAGHGLGLALVQRTMERMGGRVWAAGKPGKGATFYFTVSGDQVPQKVECLGAETLSACSPPA
jgi:signal transduction histidine kinase